MRNVVYTLIFLFVLLILFKGIILEAIDSLGFDISINKSVLFSKDGGVTWQDYKSSFLANNDLIFDKNNIEKFLLASNVGVLNIKIEETSQKEKAYKKDRKANNLWKIFQSDEQPNTIYGLSYQLDGDEVLLSKNYGKYFKKVFKVNKNDRISAFCFNFNNVFLGTKNGNLIGSNDGGESWYKIKEFSPQAILAMGCSKSNEVFIVLSSKVVNLFSPEIPQKIDSKVLVFKNEGFFEIEKLRGEKIKSIKIHPLTNEVYFVSDEKIYLYHRGGTGYINPPSDFKITAFTIDEKNPNIIYIGGRGILYKSKNNGKTWEIIDLPQKAQGKKITEIEINPNDSNLILIKISD
jgi:photosystem II stability/assembly factor-like uncharacterized protein